MCELLTFAIAEQSAGQMPKPHTQQSFGVEPHRNQGGGHDYGPGYSVWAVLQGGCSCGLVCEAQDAEQMAETELALRRKYQKRRWSEAKIERAIHNSVESAGGSLSGLRADVRLFFMDVLAACNELRFIAHSHSGGFDSEPFALAGRVDLTARELAAGMSVRFDYLHVVESARSEMLGIAPD